MSQAKVIPTKRVYISSHDELPLDYGTTPGGTLFSTTPGGTRIIYTRKSLLDLRNSPLSKSLPENLPSIPGVTCADRHHETQRLLCNGKKSLHEKPIEEVPGDEETAQFEMEM